MSSSSKSPSSAKEIWKKLNDVNSFSTNWIALQFNNEDIVVKGHGEGGYNEGHQLLKDDVMFLLVRGCHKRLKIIQRIILLLLYIPENAVGFRSAKAAYQVGVLSKTLDIGHFCLIDTRKDSNLEIEAVTERIKEIIASPGKYIIDENSNKVLREHHEEQEKNKEKPQSERKKQTESNVFKEILETEETYVRSLNLFVSSYITPMKEMAPDFYRSLATLIGIILNINSEFLNKLQKTKVFSSETSSGEENPEGESSTSTKAEEEQKKEETEGEKEENDEDTQHKKSVALMVDIIVSQCPVFKLYLPYVNEYTKLLAKVNNLIQSNRSFRDFCNKKKMELQQKKERCTDIYGFLIMPIQRIPRYQLLMRDLLKQTHSMDPNYPKIKEGLDKTLELAQYVNEKKAEAVMSVKTISISKNHKMNDLMDLKRKMLKYCEDCTIRKNAGEICVFTDLLLLIPSGKKKVFRISLMDPDVRVYDSASESSGSGKKKIDECGFVIETQRKKHVVGFKSKNVAESFIQLIQTRLSVNVGQAAMSQKLSSHIIFQSFLVKEGGGKRRSSKKKRWHELTADLKMKYYDKPNGKMKGSYSIVGAEMGKGHKSAKSSSKKEKDSPAEMSSSIGSNYAFYVKTTKRTYQLNAGNVEIFDIWVRVLSELIVLKREDLIDEETEKLHQKELMELFEGRDRKYELAELRARQAEEEARQEKLKEEKYRKMFLKLNSMIRNTPKEESGSEDEESEEEEGDKDSDGEEEQEQEEKQSKVNIETPSIIEKKVSEGEEDQVDLEILESGEVFQGLEIPKKRRMISLIGEQKSAIEEGREKLLLPRKQQVDNKKKKKTKPKKPKKRGRRRMNVPLPTITSSSDDERKKEGEEGEEKKLEEENMYQEKMKVMKKKNLIHAELRVRRKSIIQSNKLIEKIRQKHKDKTEKEEKEEDVRKKPSKEDLELAERVIQRKRNVHTELLMKKKNLVKSVPLFGKIRFPKRKKKNSSTEDKLESSLSQPSSPPPKRPSRRGRPMNRPITVSTSLRSRLKGLENLQSSIRNIGLEDDDDEKEMKKEGMKLPPIPPRRGRKPQTTEPWKNKQLVEKELLSMRKVMNKTQQQSTNDGSNNKTKKVIIKKGEEGAVGSTTIEEILKKERMKWEVEMNERLKKEKERWMKEDLMAILEEKKKEWMEELRKQVKEEVRKEMNQK